MVMSTLTTLPTSQIQSLTDASTSTENTAKLSFETYTNNKESSMTSPFKAQTQVKTGPNFSISVTVPTLVMSTLTEVPTSENQSFTDNSIITEEKTSQSLVTDIANRDATCDCGLTQCFVCTGTNEADCVNRQTLQTCPMAGDACQIEEFRDKRGSILNYTKMCANANSCISFSTISTCVLTGLNNELELCSSCLPVADKCLCEPQACDCGYTKCFYCNESSEADCHKNQQLTVCSNKGDICRIDVVKDKRGNIINYAKSCANPGVCAISSICVSDINNEHCYQCQLEPDDCLCEPKRCDCGNPRCDVCSGTDEASCFKSQQVQTCPHASDVCAEESIKDKRGSIISYKKYCADISNCSTFDKETCDSTNNSFICNKCLRNVVDCNCAVCPNGPPLCPTCNSSLDANSVKQCELKQCQNEFAVCRTSYELDHRGNILPNSYNSDCSEPSEKCKDNCVSTSQNTERCFECNKPTQCNNTEVSTECAEADKKASCWTCENTLTALDPSCHYSLCPDKSYICKAVKVVNTRGTTISYNSYCSVQCNITTTECTTLLSSDQLDDRNECVQCKDSTKLCPQDVCGTGKKPSCLVCDSTDSNNCDKTGYMEVCQGSDPVCEEVVEINSRGTSVSFQRKCKERSLCGEKCVTLSSDDQLEERSRCIYCKTFSNCSDVTTTTKAITTSSIVTMVTATVTATTVCSSGQKPTCLTCKRVRNKNECQQLGYYEYCNNYDPVCEIFTEYNYLGQMVSFSQRCAQSQSCLGSKYTQGPPPFFHSIYSTCTDIYCQSASQTCDTTYKPSCVTCMNAVSERDCEERGYRDICSSTGVCTREVSWITSQYTGRTFLSWNQRCTERSLCSPSWYNWPPGQLSYTDSVHTTCEDMQCLPSNKEFSLRIWFKIYTEYLPQYAIPYTLEWWNLAIAVTNYFHQILLSSPGYLFMKVLRFSPGSVIADMQLYFNYSIDEATVTEVGKHIVRGLIQRNHTFSFNDTSARIILSQTILTNDTTAVGQDAIIIVCDTDCFCNASSNVCSNNGFCYEDELGSAHCSCPSGYTGPYCENENLTAIATWILLAVAIAILFFCFTLLLCVIFVSSKKKRTKVVDSPLEQPIRSEDSLVFLGRRYLDPASSGDWHMIDDVRLDHDSTSLHTVNFHVPDEPVFRQALFGGHDFSSREKNFKMPGSRTLSYATETVDRLHIGMNQDISKGMESMT